MKKSSKRFFASILVVLTLSTGIGLGVNNMVRGVSKVNYNFIINENVITLPGNYLVMSKDNTTYVPLRFISESLGAKVDYKQGTISIATKPKTISQPEDTKKIEELEAKLQKIEQENRELKARIKSIDESIAYKKLPTAQKTVNDLNIKLHRIDKSGNNAILSVEFINESDYNFFIVDPFKTVVYVDGKEYKATYNSDAALNAAMNFKNSRLVGEIVIEDFSDVKTQGSVVFNVNDSKEREEKLTIFFDNR